MPVQTRIYKDARGMSEETTHHYLPSKIAVNRDALPMPALIEVADLVTEMTRVKHLFRDGINAQAGVDF